jgi:hypothetical protein
MRRAFTLLLPFLVACGGGGGSPTGPGQSTTAGTFTATIDGSAWVSTTNVVTGGGTGSNQVPGLISMTGTQVVSSTNYTTLTLTLGYIAGLGTYPLGVNHGSTAGGMGIVFAPQGGTFGTWSTNLSGSAGTLIVTSLTSSRIAGTFQFTAPPQNFSSTTGTRVVTNGAFDMPLPAGFTPAPANNNGSKMSAVIGGTVWNAATVIGLGTGGVFGLGGTSDTLSVSIQPATVVSTGNSYPNGGSGGATMIVIRTGTSKSWSSATGGSVGTITITSLVGNRAIGTFSATLLPGSGATGSLVITNGTFNVRIDSPF